MAVKKFKSLRDLRKYCNEQYAYTIIIKFYKNNGGLTGGEYYIRYYSDRELNKDSDRCYKELHKLIKKDKTIQSISETIIQEDLEDEENN